MPVVHRFGPVVVRPVERQLLIDGRPATLGARAFDVLLALVERRDRMVTKAELLDIVWPGLVVEENNLQVQVSALRKLLGANALATIPGLGYRFTLAADEPAGAAQRDPAAGASPRRTNLPAPADDLFGRDADTLDLRQVVTEHRLVTVIGAGGIGKTRIAQEVARGCLDGFSDGVWWIDLSAQSGAADIVPAMANATGVRMGPGDAIAQLAMGLASRATLLVLDNCEHLVRDVALVVRALLTSAPALRILATSQEALRITGEVLFRLEPLAVPPPETLLNKARTYSAVQLLEARARAADRRFLLAEATIADAIAVCRHLDGIPLAIEMAAARLPTIGVPALAASLDERLRILQASSRDAPGRYRTLRATLDWSHSMLNPTQQAVLRRLAVFVGSFSLHAGKTVAAGASIDEWDAVDALSSLVDKSLVQLESTEPPRYRLLETTRVYGRELLGEAGEADSSERLHGQALAVVAEQATADFHEASETLCERRYANDYDDLSAAFARACTRGDAEVAGSTGLALNRMDLARGVYTAARPRKAAAFPLIAAADPLAQARLWSCIAFGRYIPFSGLPKLTVAADEVLAWRRAGDRRQLYDALCRQAGAHATAGEPAQAERTLEEARNVEDGAWPAPVRLAFAYNAALVTAYGSDFAGYVARAQVLLEAADRTGSARLAAVARMFVVEATLNMGDLGLARDLNRASIAEMRALDLPLGRGNALSTCAAIALCSGDLATARGAAREALPFVLQNGVAGWVFDQVALLCVRAGAPDRAAPLLGFADGCYAAIEEVRRAQDHRAAVEAASAAETALGAVACARQRESGAALAPEKAEALALEALEQLADVEVT